MASLNNQDYKDCEKIFLKIKKEFRLINTFSIYLTILLVFSSLNYSYSQNWYEQLNGGTNTFEDIFFIDENTGWVVGSQAIINKTTNGGGTWIPQSSGLTNSTDLRTVFFENQNLGWAVGTQGKIIRTTNGGLNWDVQNSGVDVSKNFNSITFINSLTGWCVGHGILVNTTNGGEIWNAVQFGDYLIDVQFLDDNTGYIAQGGFPVSIIYKTTNAGVNWTESYIDSNFYLKSMYFADQNTGWVGSVYPGIIRKTTNGGFNWIDQTYDSDKEFTSIYFKNNVEGFALAYNIFTETNNFYETTNGGEIWTQYFLPTFFPFKSMSIKGNKGWVCGAIILHNPDIYLKPVDAGITSIVSPVADSVYQFNCISGNSIIPKSVVKNFGFYYQAIFTVNFEIKEGNSVVYTDSKTDTINPQQSHTIAFSQFNIPPYTFDEPLLHNYRANSKIILQNDSNSANDTLTATFKLLNPNYGYSDASGYYFLNSSTGAGCIPESPSYQWEDTTGSVTLISNGQLVIPYTLYNSFYFSGCFRLPDILPNGKKFRFFGACYDTIIVANNGVIGFGNVSLSRMNTPFPESIPSVNAPHPAIFPLWYWVNYSDPEITGRSLKYKVTDNKFIVTYDRAPLYNTIINSNDYVTYQVILETDAEYGTTDSKIKIQYNYDGSGSTFINNYNNNRLNEMTVGIQNSNATVALQYRRSESNHNVSIPGPLFGSPLTVEFAPTNSILPVELENFTSSVNENDVSLIWVVSNQANNYGFEIERTFVKNNMINEWIKIGKVSGSGTLSNAQQFSFLDRNLVSGIYKYRLKQIDFNGSLKYYELQNEVVIGVPLILKLSQNYPNPFNPITKIDIDLPQDSKLILTVYDITGREVKTLLNEFRNAGYHSVVFDGSNLSSGVYYYKITVGGITKLKKMLLIK